MQNDLARKRHHVPNKYLYALKVPRIFRDMNAILNRWRFSKRKEKLMEFYRLRRTYLAKLENYEFARLVSSKLNYWQKRMYFELLDRCMEMRSKHMPCSIEQNLIQSLKKILKSRDAGQEVFHDYFGRLHSFMKIASMSQSRSNAYLRRNHALGQSTGIRM